MMACSMDNKTEQEIPLIEHILDILQLLDYKYDSLQEEICNLHIFTLRLDYRQAHGYIVAMGKSMFPARSTPYHPISFNDEDT